MKQQIYKYAIYLFGEETPIEISQQQGEKLVMALVSSDLPKFVLIDDNIINISSIKNIERDELWSDQYRSVNAKPITRELSLSEKETHDQYLKMKKLSLANGIKLLNE